MSSGQQQAAKPLPKYGPGWCAYCKSTNVVIGRPILDARPLGLRDERLTGCTCADCSRVYYFDHHAKDSIYPNGRYVVRGCVPEQIVIEPAHPFDGWRLLLTCGHLLTLARRRRKTEELSEYVGSRVHCTACVDGVPAVRPHTIESNGITVWVNGAFGLLGRFGKHGIDIHREVKDQCEHGECLFCTHVQPPAETTSEDWRLFVQKMKELYGVDVPDEHMPTRFRS